MKRCSSLFLAILFMAWGNAAIVNAQTGCPRENLKGIISKYFAALETNNPSSLPLASNVKFTENGVEMEVGKGFCQTAGKTILKRDLIDTLKCGTHSNVVIEEKYTAPKTTAPKAKSAFPGMEVKLPADGAVRPILFGVRLRVENEKITEIETIVARETEFAFNAAAVLATKDQDWESIISPEQWSSRLAMIAAADDYFDMFATQPKVHSPFAKSVIAGRTALRLQPVGIFKEKTTLPMIAHQRAWPSAIMVLDAFWLTWKPEQLPRLFISQAACRTFMYFG